MRSIVGRLRREFVKQCSPADVVADLTRGHEELSGRPLALATAWSLVFMPPLLRPIRRPRCPFVRPSSMPCGARWLCRPSGQIGRVDHDRFTLSTGRKTFHHPGEHASISPSLPAIVKRLVEPIVPRAFRQRSPLPFTKMIPLSTGGSSTRGLPWLLGKYGSSRATCSSVSQ